MSNKNEDILVRIIEKNGAMHHQIIARKDLEKEKEKIEKRGGEIIVVIVGSEDIRKSEERVLREFYDELFGGEEHFEIDEELVLVEFVKSILNQKPKTIPDYFSRLYEICEANFQGLNVNLNFFFVAVPLMGVHHIGIEYKNTEDFLDSRRLNWEVFEHDLYEAGYKFRYEGSKDDWLFLVMLKYMIDERVINEELEEDIRFKEY